MTLMVTWLWQGTALAALVALMLRGAPRLNAATIHAVWWLTLAAVLAMPALHLVPPAIAASTALADGRLAPQATAVFVLPPLHESLLAFGVVIWTVVALTGLFRVARGCSHVRRLKRTSAPFDPDREARLPMWVAGRSGRRRPELRTCDGGIGAVALGLGGRSAIVVSRTLADALGDAELDAIVMHERAHLERYDDWFRLLQAIVESLAGMHPAVGFILRQIDVHREAACDDRVVAQSGAARRYAWALTAAAAVVGANGVGMAPAAFSSASVLRRRVERLLDADRDRGLRFARAAGLVFVLTVTIAVGTASRLPHVVTFAAMPETAQAVAPREVETPSEVAAAAAALPPLSSLSVLSVAPFRPAAPRITVERAPVRQAPESEAPRAPIAPATVDSQTTGEALVRAPWPLLPSSRLLRDPFLVPPVWPSGDEVSNVSQQRGNRPSRWSAVAGSATASASRVVGEAVFTGTAARNAGISIGEIATRAANAFAADF